MTVLSLSTRTGAIATVAVLASSLVACSDQPLPEIVSPTMAPEQSIDEACQISRDEVDLITRQVEEQIGTGLEQAGADLASGQMPSFDFLTFSVDDALADVASQVSNAEVRSAISNVRRELQGFGDIAQPESLLGAANYLTQLGNQASELTSAGHKLQSLCGEQ